MKMRNGFALGVVALCLGTAPAMAQSNYGGVNNSNVGGYPSFGNPGSTTMTGYSTTVLEQARSLQQQLADAQSTRAEGGIRIFSRTPVPAAPNERLIKAKADATAFLESVKNPGPNLLAPPAVVVGKSSPSW